MPQRKQGGRPRTKAGTEGPVPFIGFKIPRDLKSRLEAAAAASEHSIGEEARRRIAQSFEATDRIEGVFDYAYGPIFAGTMTVIGHVLPIANYLALRRLGYESLSARLVALPAAADSDAAIAAWRDVRAVVELLLAIIGPHDPPTQSWSNTFVDGVDALTLPVLDDVDMRKFIHNVLTAIASPESSADPHLTAIGKIAHDRLGEHALARIHLFVQGMPE